MQIARDIFKRREICKHQHMRHFVGCRNVCRVMLDVRCTVFVGFDFVNELLIAVLYCDYIYSVMHTVANFCLMDI